MNNQEIYNIVTNMRSNMLVLNDVVYYVSYDMDTNELYAGTATNAGIAKEYSIQYDSDMDLDYSLNRLLDLINEDPCNWELDSEIDFDVYDTKQLNFKDMKTYLYHRNPTPAEIRFGEGAIHYLEVDEKTVRKKDGTLKKWFRHKDGLRYYY